METTQPKVETIKVKYNSEVKEIPVDEAVVLAQKGMNYDKIAGRVQSLESELSQYKEQVGSFEVQRQIDAEAKSLAGQGLDESVARQLAEAKVKATMSEQELNQLKSKAAVENQINVFKAERPDVNLDAIPDEVIEAARKSGNLLKEFNAWESGLLRAELAELRKKAGVVDANAANAASSMGSADSKGDGAPLVINDQVIAKMTPEELKKNHKGVWEFLKNKKG